MKWKGREKDYHKEYMRGYRRRKKEALDVLREKAEKYDLLFGEN